MRREMTRDEIKQVVLGALIALALVALGQLQEALDPGAAIFF